MTKPGLPTRILMATPLLFVLLSTCLTAKAAAQEAEATMALDIAGIQAVMRPLIPEADSSTPPAAIADYFHFYGLERPGCRHLFGTFASQGQTLAGHIFVPPQARGTIFLLHGYYDHSGILSRLIAFCLEEGLAVAIFDLPGHGLSSGPRFAIHDFSDYTSALSAFVALCQNQLPRPFHLVAHSLGCAVVYEYLQGGNQAPFSKVIFLAPLIRSRAWRASKLITLLSRPFVSNLPRIHRCNSSDPKFLAFTKKDPLQQEMFVPLAFLDAFFSWETRAQGYTMLNQALFIIQGTEDVIVDGPYNINFLKSKFSKVHILLMAGANHQLANESPALRAELFTVLQASLAP